LNNFQVKFFLKNNIKKGDRRRGLGGGGGTMIKNKKGISGSKLFSFQGTRDWIRI